MSWVSFISFATCLLLAATTFFRRTDVFAPYRVFGFIWSLAIGLADLKFSFFQRVWTTYSWVVLLIGICSMMIGFFIAGVPFIDKPMLSFSEQRRRLFEAPVSKDKLFWTIILLSVLYIIGLCVEVQAAGTFPAFAARPDRARIEFGVFGIHLFVTTMPTILLLGTEYVVLFWKKSPMIRRLFLLLACSSVFFTFALLLQRFGYVMWAIPTICFVYYATNRIKFRHLLLSGTILLGFLQILQSIRVARYVEHYTYVVSRMRFPKTYAALTEPYMYIAMNLENFARSVEQWTSYTYGYFTFDFLMALTGLKHPLAKEFGLVERPFLISGYNTFSFLMPFYQDFGVFGVAVIPLSLGVGIGYLYHRMRRQPTVTNTTMYSVAVYLLVISFFIHALGMLTVFSNVLLLAVLHLVLLENRTRENGPGYA